ncbi:MAG: ROK family protein [Candidatus Hydrogenedentes bacterium]|nr:ROK family protein [Candidatus Hydrogenedentota bacterium]
MGNPLGPNDRIVGLDIGGTKMMAVVLNNKFKVLGRCRKKSRSEDNANEKPEDRICRIVRLAMEDAKVDTIRGIGVGSPGPLDPNTGVIIDTPNLGWKNFPLGRMLSKTFGVPTVVNNDVNLGTYGEWRFGKIKDAKNVIGVFPGTGIGGGLILNGSLFHGFSGAAGEVGHMTIEVDGPYCGCGKRGCLEAVASRLAIASQVAAMAARGDAPYILANCGTDMANIRSGSLAKAIEAGDAMVEGVVRKAAYYVGIGVANLINIMSPEAVVLGGGLVEAMPKIYLDECQRAVKYHAMPFLRKGVKIVAARLGDDAVALGAGKLLVEHLATL